jgi:hypothetical protein
MAAVHPVPGGQIGGPALAGLAATPTAASAATDRSAPIRRLMKHTFPSLPPQSSSGPTLAPTLRPLAVLNDRVSAWSTPGLALVFRRALSALRPGCRASALDQRNSAVLFDRTAGLRHNR